MTVIASLWIRRIGYTAGPWLEAKNEELLSDHDKNEKLWQALKIYATKGHGFTVSIEKYVTFRDCIYFSIEL